MPRNVHDVGWITRASFVGADIIRPPAKRTTGLPFLDSPLLAIILLSTRKIVFIYSNVGVYPSMMMPQSLIILPGLTYPVSFW